MATVIQCDICKKTGDYNQNNVLKIYSKTGKNGQLGATKVEKDICEACTNKILDILNTGVWR